MRWILALVALLLASTGELAAQSKGKGIRLWNLTTSTISGFQLSPAGKDTWGPNQTLNDKDKEVDHDERLRITGVEPGHYDAKVSLPRRPAMPVKGSKSRRMRCSIADKDSGLQQVILRRYALSLGRGYSQRHLTAVHFGWSPTHCAI
jgi:hypothetical protein